MPGMSDLGIVFDRRFNEHDTGGGFPECGARLDAVESALEMSGHLAAGERIEVEPISSEALERVHAPEYAPRIERACRAGRRTVDEPDVAVCHASYEIARLAAGGAVRAARGIGLGQIRRAFCAVRPPGHHAERNRAMGFCLFNNVALAAAALRAECGIERVLILDWDVHHGNGTQHAFEQDPSVLFISLHEHPDHQYPGTGYGHEIGDGAGQGATLNIPLLPGAGDAALREAFESQVVGKVADFEPQVVLISAGFDAHRDDPLGRLQWSDEAYVWMLRQLITLADRTADGRVLSVLEGGYNLGVLNRCVREHVELLGG